MQSTIKAHRLWRPVVLIVFMTLWLLPVVCSAALNRPNIIFLMDDQHRWDALGIVDPAVKTPNLDALARHGVFFDQAVCQAPMCTPSRNSMMLGLYPNQIGVLRNGRGIPDKALPSRPLPAALKAAGYQTAGFGKTHWGGVYSTRGFETRYVAECLEKGAIMMKDVAPEAKRQYDAESKTMGAGEENNLGYLGFTSHVPEKNHRDGWVTERCLDFIQDGIDPNRPLFLYLSFLKPHAGHNVPAGYEAQYDPSTVTYARQPPWETDRSPHAFGINRRDMYCDFWSRATDEQWRMMTLRYHANCTWIDDMFGRVLQALRQKGVLDNALIVYCSDHGEMLGERFYRFNKYCLYESSVRVPVILSGSALPATQRGTQDHRPVELLDLYPTLLKAAGAPVPASAVGLDLLADRKRPASFCALHERKDEAAFMWRTARYKLILRMKRKDNASQYSATDILGGEFYDLKADPQEWEDLYADPGALAGLQRTMTESLLTHLRKQAPVTPTGRAEAGDAVIPIVVNLAVSRAEQMAARELQTGLAQLYPDRQFPVVSERANDTRQILIGTPGAWPELKHVLPGDMSSDEGFVVTHRSQEGLIVGRTGRAVLYGVTRLLESLGQGHYLSFDTPGKRQKTFAWEAWDIKDEPLVPRRLVFNWHNFLSGCSTWRLQDWQQWIRQSQKMGYNAVMVHAYGNNPMAGFSFRGHQKPVGYLSSTRIGRDWSTNHVNDVRHLHGGDVFDEPVFGCDASIDGTDLHRTCAAQALMQQVFAAAQDRDMDVYFAVDVDTTSANPPVLIESLGESERFQSKGHWLARPDTPGGYAFYLAQVKALLRVYPTLDSLVIWHRTGNTPWMSFNVEDMPQAWQDEYARLCREDPGTDKLWHSVHIFGQAKIVTAFKRALEALGRPDVKIAFGSWQFSFMAAADRFMPSEVELIGLDYNVLHGRSSFDLPEGRAQIAKVARHRSVIPVAWAQHDDGNYVGRPYTPYANFYDKLADMQCADSGYGIIHWTTWPLDLYFKSLVQQVWAGSRNEGLSVTCARMAKDLIGPEQAGLMASYLEDWVTTMQKVGRETGNHFSDRPRVRPDQLLAEVPGVRAGLERRMARLNRIDLSRLTPDEKKQVAYFKGLEDYILALYENDSHWIYAHRAWEAGELADARRQLAQANPERVISDFAALSKAHGITRGEQGLVVTMNTRWLPDFVQLRQCLGMEAVRVNFAPTSHDPLAQSRGIYTFLFDQDQALWETRGTEETGQEVFELLPKDLLHLEDRDIQQAGIKSKIPFEIHLGAVLASPTSPQGALPAGDYILSLWSALPASGQGQVFKVSVYEQASVRPRPPCSVYACQPISGRSLKIVCNGNSQNDWNSIHQIRCAALDASKQPVASAQADGTPPTCAVDGDMKTRWAAQGRGQWLQVALDPQRPFDQIKIDWYQGSTRLYACDFYVSQDGVTWQPIQITHVKPASESGMSPQVPLLKDTVRLQSQTGMCVKRRYQVTLNQAGVLRLRFEPIQGEAAVNGLCLTPR